MPIKQSNIKIMKLVRKAFADHSQDSKTIKANAKQKLIEHLKLTIKQDFQFSEIDLNTLEEINIRPSEKNLMIRLSLNEILGKSTENRIEDLLFFMNYTKNDLEDLDDFLIAGYDLYTQILANFNPLYSTTIIQYFSALLEEFLKKFLAIQSGRNINWRIEKLTLAQLIKNNFKFSPYQSERRKIAELDPWQVPFIWCYELRNYVMHNIILIPENTFKQLFLVQLSALLLAAFKNESLKQIAQ